MVEQLVTFEVAKLAKDRGFDIGVNDEWVHNTNEPLDNEYYTRHWSDRYNFNKHDYISAPSQSLLQRWLREKHNIHVSSDLNDSTPTNINFVYCVTTSYNNWNSENYGNYTSTKLFNSYEEALEEGLLIALGKCTLV